MRLSRSMPSAEVNSVMIRPQPPRLRMKRRNTVSVMPDMGASRVAGAMRTPPRETESGTRAETESVARAPSPAALAGVSQYLRTSLFYRVEKNGVAGQKTKASSRPEALMPSDARKPASEKNLL